MTTKLETELTTLLSDIIAIKTLLENNKAILQSVPRLADFLEHRLDYANMCINHLNSWIEHNFLKEQPS